MVDMMINSTVAIKPTAPKMVPVSARPLGCRFTMAMVPTTTAAIAVKILPIPRKDSSPSQPNKKATIPNTRAVMARPLGAFGAGTPGTPGCYGSGAGPCTGAGGGVGTDGSM